MHDAAENTRSWLYGHDGLSRLRSAERGALAEGDDAIDRTTQGVPTPRRVSWGLDRLGNWTRGAGQTDGGGEFVYAGRVEESDDDLDGEYESGELVEARAHAADLRNRLMEVGTDTGGGPSAEAIVYDLAGNLVADDLYWYQYDAFNRLACVRLKGTLEFDADGFVEDGEPGAWRAHFAYDALGRLVSKQVPWGAQGADERWCWYYYDGVRRIAEVFRDPLMVGGGIGGGGPPGGGGYSTYTDREYVWGPDYVDECLWQVDKIGDAAFVLQDANSNVVGLADDEGALLRQYAWDPYGQAIAVDSLGIFGHNRLGHQGLFFDRLDANAPNADLTATARGVYYARNRPYEPRLGVWMTSDPNGTGMAVVSRDTGGHRVPDLLGNFDALVLYSDGLNAYAHLGSNPLVRSDPYGLEFSLTSLFSSLLSRPIVGNVAMTGGRIAFSLVDDVLMGYSGTSMAGGLIGGGTIVGAGLVDDLLRPASRSVLQWTQRALAKVRDHNWNNLAKKVHGVFDTDGVAAVGDAMARAEMLGIEPIVQGGRRVFNVPMGQRIGWEGGHLGSGEALSTIRVVITEAGEVVTAYPVR